jgi:hypothetical protein
MKGLQNIPEMPKCCTILIKKGINVVLFRQIYDWFEWDIEHIFGKPACWFPPCCPQGAPKVELLVGVGNSVKLFIQDYSMPRHYDIVEFAYLIGTYNRCIANLMSDRFHRLNIVLQFTKRLF